jgi:hypothetical protein
MLATKTVAEKLQIKPDSGVWVSDAAQIARIRPLPAGAKLVDRLAAATVGLIFVNDASSTRTILSANAADLAKPAALWIVYPKANRTDINRDSLWPIVGEFGMRPNSQIAIDDVWSALRFRALAEGEELSPAGH